MTDLRALPRLLDELVWVLRRDGLTIAPSQVVDLGRAASLVGIEDRVAVREAIASIVVQRVPDRPRFDAVFTSFFARAAPTRGLWERLADAGFTAGELDVLRELLGALASGSEEGEGAARLGALLEGGGELARLFQLPGVVREVQRIKSPLQLGFGAHRASQALGLPGAHRALAALRQNLRGAIGARGDALADLLGKELEERTQALRDHIRAGLERAREDAEARGKGSRDDVPFTALTDRELVEVRRAVRSFGDRLRGAERVRARRARRGTIDPARTLRASLRTGGVPFRPARRRRRRDRPKLFLLCDVSDSVRTASRFMLELVYAAQELFARTRSFVFVSELGEATRLFRDSKPEGAMAAAYGGGLVPVTDNSNYGRVLRAFEERYLPDVDRRTTVVILGDGRTNYHAASEDVLARLRGRARALYWLSTEPRAAWASGDSAMPRYAPLCTQVFEVTTARELEEAARVLAQRR